METPVMREGAIRDTGLQYELPIAGFRDTAFTENRSRGIHRWVPWIAGFSSAFVSGILERERRPGQPLTVLDPFAGVGTTLIEAIRSGDEGIGFEINPYAALACQAKVSVLHYDTAQLAAAIEHFNDYADERLWLSTPPDVTPPGAFRSRVPFFSPNVQTQVLACIEFIQKESTGWVKRLFELALGSVLVSFSNYSYEPSLGTRAAAGKSNIEQADVPGIVERKLWDMHDDIIRFQSELSQTGQPGSAVVHATSYMTDSDLVEPKSVDVLITSPPYMNNYHYIRNTRPQLFWLGLVDSTPELKTIEHQSFGRFWQTVRADSEVALRPKLPHLQDQLGLLRNRNVEKGAYGGPGWANYAATYFNDCDQFCRVTKPLMRPGGSAIVVIGNSILQGLEFKTDRLFGEIAELHGFDVVEFHEVRSKRTGNSVVNSSVRVGRVSVPTRLYETAVELRVN